jgi:putative tricarboxylic transport membrane protein
MDLFANLATGFGAAVTPVNLGFCLFGCLIGTLIGVLPGIGPIATIAMLLPVTFGLSPLGALIMLAGIYYGAQYGGSTTAILVNLPGESSSVVTCIDGYQMAQKGRAGAALAIAAVGSFIAGCVGTVLIAAFAPVLAAFAVKFRSPEYFALMLFGLIAAVILAHGSVIKAVGMVILGLLVGLVGTESQSATARFTFGVPELYDGVDFVPLAMGLFGLAEILSNLDRSRDRRPAATMISTLWPSRCSGSCPGVERYLPRLPPTPWRRRPRAMPPSSARARSRVSPRPRPPTMPARRPRSFRCSRSAFRRTRSWR